MSDGSRLLRVPPHSVDAEQAVLGGLMLSEPAWWEVCDLLSHADFYRRDHQIIFRAIEEMRRARRACDAVTLCEWFEANGFSSEVGGMGYVLGLANDTPSAANVRAYAGIVSEKSRLRSLIDVGTKLVGDAFQPGTHSAVDLIGAAQSRISELLTREPCELETVQPVMDRVYARLTHRYEAGGEIHGLTTGLTDLDAILGGLRAGQLGIIAARPKMGKTTLAQNIAEHVTINLGKAVAVFSFEMQPDELGDRMLSSLGGISSTRVRSGKLDEVDWSNVSAALAKLRGAKLFISKPRRARVDHVVAQLRRQHAITPLSLAVVDYLQLMDAPGDNRSQAIGDITRALKLAAGELNIPILLLSQLNRDLERRPDKRPVPADLRDSGSIEQDADFVLFIYRDEIYHADSVYKGTAELIVALQRNGPADDARVLYHPDRFKFMDLPSYWEPERREVEKPRRSGFTRTPIRNDYQSARDGE